MISVFGAISAIIAVVCIAVLVLHFKLMKKRGPVDDAFAQINELLYRQEHEEEALDTEVKDAIKAYNDAVGHYNAYISKLPGIVIAGLVGMKKEKEMP